MSTTSTQRLVFILLACGTSALASAQTFEQADARTFETRYVRALPIGGGRWAMLGASHFGGAHVLSILNGTGEVAWEQIGDNFLAGELGSVVLMPDSGLLHVGVFDPCDYIPPISRIKRFSMDGVLLWDLVIEREYGHTPSLAAKGTSSLIAIAGGDSTLFLGLDGQYSHGWPTPAPVMSLKHMHWHSDTALYMVFADQLRLMHANGGIIGSTSFNGTPRDVHFDGEVLHVLTDQMLRLYDPHLTLMGSHLLQSGHAGWSLHPAADGLYISTSGGLYGISNGVPDWLFPWPVLPSVSTAGAAVRDGRLLVVGRGSIGMYQHGMARAFPIDAAPAQHDEDVEVLLEVDSVWSEFAGGSYWNRKAAMAIRVVNHGNAPLERVAVSSRSAVPWILCAEPGLHADLVGLSVQPGDTLLAWQGVHTVRYGAHINTAGTEIICVAALAPNGKADRQPDDNLACISEEFHVGIPEALGHRLSIVPNPAIARCVVTGLDAIGSGAMFMLIDAAGRVAREGTLTRTAPDAATIELAGVPAGAYHLRLHGSTGTATGRLIVIDER